MEYALGLTVTVLGSILAMWINDRFNVGGSLQEEETEKPGTQTA
jgi:hypothetical protein